MFTTKAVKSGDPLLCEKEFQFVYADSSGTKPGCSKISSSEHGSASLVSTN